MKPIAKFWVTVLNFAVVVALASCESKEQKHEDVMGEVMAHSADYADGDIAFRRGVGVTSHVVLMAEDRGSYSHVGILFRNCDGWMVVHAVPDEREPGDTIDHVKVDSLGAFFAFDRASNGAIMRVKADEQLRTKAAALAQEYAEAHTPFDHDYDSSDTARLYCTELVTHVYGRLGVDICRGNATEVNVPGVNGSIVMPDDLTKGGMLQPIMKF